MDWKATNWARCFVLEVYWNLQPSSEGYTIYGYAGRQWLKKKQYNPKPILPKRLKWDSVGNGGHCQFSLLPWLQPACINKATDIELKLKFWKLLATEFTIAQVCPSLKRSQDSNLAITQGSETWALGIFRALQAPVTAALGGCFFVLFWHVLTIRFLDHFQERRALLFGKE